MPPKDIWTLENLADAVVIGGLKVSVDGKQVIYTVKRKYHHPENEHPRSALWLAETDKAYSARQLTSGLFMDEQPQWSIDGRDVYFLSDRHKAGKSKQIYRISVQGNGGEAVPITPTNLKNGVEVFEISPKGQFIAFKSQDEPTKEDEERERDKAKITIRDDPKRFARLRVLNTATGSVKTLPGYQEHFISSFTWSENSQSVIFRPTRVNPFEWLPTELNLQRWQLTDDTIHSVGLFPIIADAFTPSSAFVESQSGELYTTASFDPKKLIGSSALWRLSLDSSKPYFGSDNWVSKIQRASGSSNDEVYCSVAEGLQSAVYALRKDSDTPLLLYADTGSPDFTLRDYDWDVQSTDSGYTIAFVACSDGQPMNVQTCRVPVEGVSLGGQIEPIQLSKHNDNFAAKDADLLHTEKWEWTAKDGTEIEGVAIFPPNGKEAKKPMKCSLAVHGGPSARDTFDDGVTASLTPRYFAAQGYLVLRPNYRGSTGRGHAFAADADGGVGGNDWTDCRAMVDHAIQLGHAESGRLAVMGWSQGGFMTAKAITATKNIFACAIMGAGVSDWPSMATTSDLPDFEAALGGDAPWSGLLARSDGNPILQTEGVETATLIIHGEEDKRVPFNQAIGFYRALKRRGKFPERTTLVSYGGEPHGFQQRAHYLDYMARATDLLSFWLP